MECLVEDCENPSFCRGWCGKHYWRWQHHGDPLGGADHAPRYALRWFVEAAIASDTDECIIWTYPIPKVGYAYLNWHGKRRRAHIVVCEEVHGPKPPDKDEVAHSCGHKLCLNPRHVRWATKPENAADKVLHGTANRGERVHWTKLNEAQVREIKAALAAKETHRSIAARYDVSTSAVDLIATGRNWAWLV
jgi:hypothetical protein